MGPEAPIYARKRADELRARNDYEGEEVWQAVAHASENIRIEDEQITWRSRRLNFKASRRRI